MKYLLVLVVALSAVGCTDTLTAAEAPRACWDCKNRISHTLPSGEQIWTCDPWVPTECALVPDYIAHR